jgi:hypothetical protein
MIFALVHYPDNQSKFMIKAITRALFITCILVLIGAALWYYTIITIIVIVFAWLAFMFYVDPPEDWQ